MSRRGQAIPREAAPGLVLAFAASCAVTIAATRAYLDLTGYPSIGGAVYHLAHALWGGLALTVSTLLLLALSNRWVPMTAALLGGVGAGLFVDEVGKFITRKNDYFFPLAASIVYLFLVLLALAVLVLRRYRRSSPAANLHAAFEIAAGAADGGLSGPERARLRQRLDAALSGSQPLSPDQDRAARALRSLAVSAVGVAETAPAPGWWRMVERAGVTRVRRLTRVLLWANGLVGLVALVALPVSRIDEAQIIPRVIANVIVGAVASGLAVASFAVAGIAGLLCLVADRAMRPRHTDVARAERFGYAALGTLLVVGNSLGAYTSQFGILIDATIQVATLAALAAWARLVKTSAERGPDVEAEPTAAHTPAAR